MSERFEVLYKLPSNLYKEAAPVIISAGALLKDMETDTVVVQLKFQSVSETKIKALKVSLKTYDVSGEVTSAIEEYQYLDLDINDGEYFGSNKAIVIPDNVTRSFEIEKLLVVFKDRDNIEILGSEMQMLNSPQKLSAILSDSELIKQYQIEVSDQGKYTPENVGDLWVCTCGEWNKGSVCTRCRTSKKIVFQTLDIPSLNAKREKRLVDEKIEQERQKEISQIVQNEAKKRKKRQITLITLISIPVIIFTSLIIGVSRYNAQHKYDAIAGTYILADASDAWDTIADFKNVKWYKLSFEPDGYDIEIDGSGRVLNGIWYVDEGGDLSLGSGKISDYMELEDSIEMQIKIEKHPNSTINFTINTKTGKVEYSAENGERYSEKLHLVYKKEKGNDEIPDENNVIDEQKTKKEIDIVKEILSEKTKENILDLYPQATINKDDLSIDGTILGIGGEYNISFEDDDTTKVIIFRWDDDIKEFSTIDIVDELCKVLGDNTAYYSWRNRYEWEKNDLQVNLYADDMEIWFDYSSK